LTNPRNANIQLGHPSQKLNALFIRVSEQKIYISEKVAKTGNDSKKLSANQRMLLKEQIQKEAVAFAVAKVDAPEIDQINILNSSFKAMHKAIDNLSVKPELLLIDGNRFHEYPGIPHVCFVKGDGRFLSIAAASILAKIYRDDFMEKLHHEYPEYNWIKNKGYPTMEHKLALQEHGLTPYHRKSFNYNLQLKIKF